MRHSHPLFASSLVGAALLAWTGVAPAAQPDIAAEIRELKARLEALEAQQKAQAAPAKAVEPVKAATAGAGEAKLGETRFTWGGYVKLDALYSRFSEGEVLQGTGRDFFVPNSIPVSNGSGHSRSFTDLHAKSTRLFFKTETPFDGHKVGTHVEFDFIVNQSTTASERVTNAYTPGFRRGFVTFDNWLAGQDWTTFINLAALPEALDFVEFPSAGTVFVRQPMLRYTHGDFSIALENPETAVLPMGGGTIGDTNDAKLPDVIGRYTFKFGASNEVSVAGLYRQLRIENTAAAGPPVVPERDDSASGYGVSVAGKILFGADDLKFMVSTGKGIGRYLALGTSADAVLDAKEELDAIDVTAGFLAYKHAWNPQWRSTLMLAMFSADNDVDLTGAAVTKEVRCISANLLYSPVPKLTFGAEVRHAEREVESGDDGNLDRLQLSARYNF